MVQEIIEQTEELLNSYKHPDPYRPPTAPGGSKYQRNLPPPYTDREYLRASIHIGNSTDFVLSATDEPQGVPRVIFGLR